MMQKRWLMALSLGAAALAVALCCLLWSEGSSGAVELLGAEGAGSAEGLRGRELQRMGAEMLGEEGGGSSAEQAADAVKKQGVRRILGKVQQILSSLGGAGQSHSRGLSAQKQQLVHAWPQPEQPVNVCEPWPSCCGSNTENCYGVITGGVLGMHECTGWPNCCGTTRSNCMDADHPGPALPEIESPPTDEEMDMLLKVCEGKVQLAQCMVQTQSCLKPIGFGHYRRGFYGHAHKAGTCTCMSSSVYCSWPQKIGSCSPCPFDCQKILYRMVKEQIDEEDGAEVYCRDMEDDEAPSSIGRSDSTFRPFNWNV